MVPSATSRADRTAFPPGHGLGRVWVIRHGYVHIKENIMKKLLILAALLMGSLYFAPENIAAQDRSPEFNRSHLERSVRKEILSLPYYSVFDAIGYKVDGATVTLTGYVLRGVTKNDAEEAVGDIIGVSKVVDNIEVLPPSPSDDRLRRKVLETLMNRGGSLYRYFLGTNPSIRIIVKNGRVSLEGYADTKADSNLAYNLTRGVSGSFEVTNNLKVMDEAR